MLRAVRAVMHGPLKDNANYGANATDAHAWRKLPYVLLIVSLLVFGFFPKLLTEKIKPVTEQIVNMATVKPEPPNCAPRDRCLPSWANSLSANW